VVFSSTSCLKSVCSSFLLLASTKAKKHAKFGMEKSAMKEEENKQENEYLVIKYTK